MENTRLEFREEPTYIYRLPLLPFVNRQVDPANR